MRKALFTAALFCAATSSSTMAAYIPNAITTVTGIPFHQGDSNTFDGDGNIARAVNGAGITVGNVNDPSTWTHSSGWQNGWQGSGGSGTLIADLGSQITNLDRMYIWNVSESPTTTTRGVKTIDIYYATSPTVAPAMNTTANFDSGGWTLLSAGVTVAQSPGTATSPISANIDLSTIPQARYIGLKLIENYGSTSPLRIGVAEVQFTQAVPEPSALAFGAMAVGGLLCRRRRR